MATDRGKLQVERKKDLVLGFASLIYNLEIKTVVFVGFMLNTKFLICKSWAYSEAVKSNICTIQEF